MMKKADGKWRWGCPGCGAANAVPGDMPAEALFGNRVVCPNCASGYLIDRGLNLRPEGTVGRFLATAAIERTSRGWVAPDPSEMLRLTAAAVAAAVESGIEVVAEYPDARSVAVRCSPAKAMLLSKDPRICAVAPMEA